MSVRDMAERNCILKHITGSHLYGTNVPTSDKDYSGIFIADKSYYLGLESVNEVDFSITDKLESGKNSSKAIDLKLYEFRKYVKLLMENNPNILETLFIRRKHILFMDEFGGELLRNKHLFPHQGLAEKFIGYSKSQLHKMKVKPDNLKALIDARDYLGNTIESGVKVGSPIDLLLGSGTPDFIKFSSDFCSIGDLKFNLQNKIGDVLESVATRIEKASHRADGFLNYGYDTKFGMHCVRLLLEGKELLETGNLVFPLKEKNFLLDIRNGKYTADQIIKFAEDISNELNSKTYNVLPKKSNFNVINSFLIDTVEQYHEKVH
jgi:hypothetical protein